MNSKQSFLWTFLAIYLPNIFWPLIGIYFITHKNFNIIAWIVLCAGALRLFCEVIYFFHKKARPYQLEHVVPAHSAWMFSPYKLRPDSFPSAHAATLFYGSFYLLFAHFYFLGVAALVMAFLNAWSRVRLLYHYWIDIVGGFILAGFWLIFMRIIAKI